MVTVRYPAGICLRGTVLRRPAGALFRLDRSGSDAVQIGTGIRHDARCVRVIRHGECD